MPSNPNDTTPAGGACCPNCGYCPHCGRANAPAYPLPAYPWLPGPAGPWYPRWAPYIAPYITWGGGGNSASDSTITITPNTGTTWVVNGMTGQSFHTS